ncbi:glycerophosphodiester phosphodiesterase family protein [Sphingobacterium sp. BIGb0165]|uniref:glycerophosphodiester phosphodiesterase n=1 Tax=Sphingobacterium sp. BIGb0165 TaxID=2940615 RepID=UPI002169A616|nr:glycerophosphodiester phosphodiesterase family protein [Sphingobacterium sp. BIGb0165]MCS4225017.1 glycerophosphoryl diester phosphodiesterase [Sphingobacterium sp. BIGb0165]
MKKHIFSCLTLAMVISSATLFAQTKAIAHRGVWKNSHLPQNSIASLKAAHDLKLFGSEFDVHLTKDNILVVNHDNDFYGIDIATATYTELLAKKHPNGESIPTLEEYIKAGKKLKGLRLVLELKTNKLGVERTLEAATKSVEMVKNLKAEKITDYIAFSFEACQKIHELAPKANIQYLNGDKSPADVNAAGINGLDYHFSVFKKNASWLQEAHQLGMKVNAWTVNTEEEMSNLIGQKIDFITTDEPELLLQVLKK